MVVAVISGDVATALSFVSPEIRALMAGSNPCSPVNEDVTYDAYMDTRTTGETTFVTWLWEWDEPEKTIHYEFSLSNIEGEGWRIFNGDTIYRNAIDVRTEMVDPESVIQEDPNLPSEVIYTLQEGTPVEQITRIQVISGDGIERTETVISEELATPTQNGIQVVGTGTMPDLMAQAKSFASDYFASYQANDWATITSVTYPDDIDNYDIANANALAGTRIVDIDVDDVSHVDYVYVENISEYSGIGVHINQTLNRPVAVIYEMPAFIRYEIFGRVTTWEDTVTVLYTPDGWQMRYWGVTKAGEAETIVRDSFELTINGVATMPDRVLVVTTPVSPVEEYDFRTGDDVDGISGLYDDVEYDENMFGIYTGRPLHPNASTVTVNYRISPMVGDFGGEVVFPLR